MADPRTRAGKTAPNRAGLYRAAPGGAVTAYSGWSRVAWLAGPVAVGLGLAAHVLGGAGVPALIVVVALAALIGLLATGLVRLRVPGWGLFLASAVVQQLLHMAFTAFAGAGGVGTWFGHHSPALPSSTPAVGTLPPGTPRVDEIGAADMHTSELLLYTHTAAALLTVALVALAERVLAGIQARRKPSRADQGEADRKG